MAKSPINKMFSAVFLIVLVIMVSTTSRQDVVIADAKADANFGVGADINVRRDLGVGIAIILNRGADVNK
ncbi:hypothetical protein C5167_035825, partial [Papaver somniferum]